YDQQLARELGKGRGLGLAPMILRQLERSTGATTTGVGAGALPLRATGAPAAAMPLAPTAAMPAMLPLAPTRSGVSMPGMDLQAYAMPAPALRAPDFDQAAFGAEDAPLDASSPEAFVQSIWPQAQKAAAELGVPAKALVAQAAPG